MTLASSSTTLLGLKDLESIFHKSNKERRKGKDESKVKPNRVESEYVTDSESKKDNEPKDEMDDIMEMTMDEYKKRMGDNGLGHV